MHRFQDNINLGTGETEEDRQQIYTNQGVTVVTTTVDATLDLAASTTWLVRDAAAGLMLSLFEDSAGGTTQVAIGGAFGSGNRFVDIFSVHIASTFEITSESNDAVARTSSINVVNLGAEDHTLNLRADIVNIAAATQVLGFFAQAGTARTAAYTPTNVTPDRAFDADTVAIAELADVVATMIADLQGYGLFA